MSYDPFGPDKVEALASIAKSLETIAAKEPAVYNVHIHVDGDTDLEAAVEKALARVKGHSQS